MQKRKFDELISHFNCKVSDMSIDQKYKMELLGMISAIGFAHEKELSTNLASLGKDCISRQQAIDALRTCYDTETITMDNGDEYINYGDAVGEIEQLPPIQPKRGRWVLVCDNNGMHFICNKCGAWRYHQEQKFCGECGADMREKGENSESN